MTTATNPNCDGEGPHTPGECRLYPLGGEGAAILCQSCWDSENTYNAFRQWPTQDWTGAERS